MGWIIVVLLLALAWVLIRQNRPAPAPPADKELPDPQDLLAGRLVAVAADARQDGRHKDAQAAELKVAWLKTRPLLGHDDPPAELSPNEQKHLRFAGDIWERVSEVLTDESQPFAGCRYKPSSLLPFPKDYVDRALGMLIDVGEGRQQSIHFRPEAIPQDVVNSMKAARQQLGAYVDVSTEELPSDANENARYGEERGW
jgi:hypothetical protein